MTDEQTRFAKQFLDFWQQQTLLNLTEPNAVRAMLDMMERTAHGAWHGTDTHSTDAPPAADEPALEMAGLERRLRTCEARITALEQNGAPTIRNASKRRTKKT